MIKLLSKEDNTTSFLPTHHVVDKCFALNSENCIQSIRILTLECEIRMEKFLHDYYKHLYMNLLNTEVEQCIG